MEQKTTNLNIRIEKSLKSLVDRAAEKSDISSSEWIRQWLEYAARVVLIDEECPLDPVESCDE